MKKLAVVCIFFVCIIASPVFAQDDPFAAANEGLKALREGVIQGRQMRYEEEDRARAEQQRQREAIAKKPLPMVSANGFDCSLDQEKPEAIFCLGSFKNMSPHVVIAAFAPKLVNLMANGVDTDTGKPTTFLYESLTGCVVQINRDENEKKIIDQWGKTYKLKKNQKIKGCLN